MCRWVQLTDGLREAGEARALVSGHPNLLNCGWTRSGWVFQARESAFATSGQRWKQRGSQESGGELNPSQAGVPPALRGK